MATQTLEQRVSTLESELRELRERLGEEHNQPWWRKITGIFKDDPDFDEAMRLGREYRLSLRDHPEDTVG
jgi:hypothetical protein